MQSVSTPSVDELVKALGMSGNSKRHVSNPHPQKSAETRPFLSHMPLAFMSGRISSR